MLTFEKNIPLAPFTTFRIGGPAKYFVKVRNAEEIQEALKWAESHKESLFFLGGGSNILISDEGFNGLVIFFEPGDVEVEGENIRTPSGTLLETVVDIARDHSLFGLQNLAGIPGSVGGAVRGNAGAFGVEIKDVVSSVRCVNKKTFEIRELNNQECHFSYRMSVFKEREELIVASVVFDLDFGNKEEIDVAMKEIIAKRNDKQDQMVLCAGSFFVNPTVENEELRKEFEEEAGVRCRENKVPAGWLIDKVGLRGKTMGGAMVSRQHPNYIINMGDATASDVIMLMSYVKQQVRDTLNVQLTQEVQFVGFD
jgi:UDP-N-acetylmuramate dehydrogenase